MKYRSGVGHSSDLEVTYACRDTHGVLPLRITTRLSRGAFPSPVTIILPASLSRCAPGMNLASSIQDIESYSLPMQVAASQQREALGLGGCLLSGDRGVSCSVDPKADDSCTRRNFEHGCSRVRRPPRRQKRSEPVVVSRKSK